MAKKNLHDKLNDWAKAHLFDMACIIVLVLVIMQYAGPLVPYVHALMTLLAESEQMLEVWGTKHPLLVATIPLILQYAFPPKGRV